MAGMIQNMKRIILLISILFIFLLFGCSTQTHQDTISRWLGIDVSTGSEVSTYDNHGGFHGDGTTLITLSFSDDKALRQIEESNEWKKFPLDDTAIRISIGVSDGTNFIGPYLTDNTGKTIIPEIENGYYFLIDKQENQDEIVSKNILNRYSLNFVLGIYDTDTDILYFCEFDT